MNIEIASGMNHLKEMRRADEGKTSATLEIERAGILLIIHDIHHQCIIILSSHI